MFISTMVSVLIIIWSICNSWKWSFIKFSSLLDYYNYTTLNNGYRCKRSISEKQSSSSATSYTSSINTTACGTTSTAPNNWTEVKTKRERMASTTGRIRRGVWAEMAPEYGPVFSKTELPIKSKKIDCRIFALQTFTFEIIERVNARTI